MFNYEAPKEISYNYAISDLKVTKISGEELYEPLAGESFTVNVGITKTLENDDEDYLFVAVYSTDGELLSIDYVKTNFSQDEENSFEFNIEPQTKPIGSVKGYVWDSLNSMNPLAETKELTFKQERMPIYTFPEVIYTEQE